MQRHCQARQCPASSGKVAAERGNATTVHGNAFATLGEAFAGLGNALANLGDLLATNGKTPARTRNRVRWVRFPKHIPLFSTLSQLDSKDMEDYSDWVQR